MFFFAYWMHMMLKPYSSLLRCYVPVHFYHCYTWDSALIRILVTFFLFSLIFWYFVRVCEPSAMSVTTREHPFMFYWIYLNPRDWWCSSFNKVYMSQLSMHAWYVWCCSTVNKSRSKYFTTGMFSQQLSRNFTAFIFIFHSPQFLPDILPLEAEYGFNFVLEFLIAPQLRRNCENMSIYIFKRK